MANIVELRDKTDAQLEEMLENAREEMFNLRFQKAMARLTDASRIRTVRREMAQLQTVLNNRQTAISAAAAEPAIATALDGKEWDASARYVYEDQGFRVEFTDDGATVASALVNLNQKQPRTRRTRAVGSNSAVVSHEVG